MTLQARVLFLMLVALAGRALAQDSTRAAPWDTVMVPSGTGASHRDTMHLSMNPGRAPEARRFTLSVSPLWLLFPGIQASGEYRTSPRTGLAVFGGLGRQKEVGENGESDEVSYRDWGGQFRYYPRGWSRHAPHFGLQAFWLEALIGSRGEEESIIQGMWIEGSLIGGGPFVGYKYVAPWGFTIVTQAGIQVGYGTMGISFSEDTEPGGDIPTLTVLPLVSLHMGWSF
jgi:hypothetical protein